jgi:hypothetical protein
MQIPKSSMVMVAVCGYIGSFETVKRAHMPMIRRHMVRRQGRTGRRLRVCAPCRWLVLLLVLAIAASGLLHGSGSGHAAAAAAQAHDLASVSQGPAGSGPCCHEDEGQSQGTLCSTATGCSLCVPIVSVGVCLQAGAVRTELEPTGDHSGRIQTPQLRPPKLLASA